MNTRMIMPIIVGMYVTFTIGAMSLSPIVAAEESDDIPTNAQNTGEHDSLVAALAHAALVTALQAAGPFTVFAPTDAAFKNLPKGTVETLLDPRNDDRLEEVFGFHVKETSEAPIFIEKYSLLRMTTRQFLSVNYKEKKLVMPVSLDLSFRAPMESFT